MAQVAQAIQASAEEVGYKVFVGNLAFGLTEDDLKEYFGSAGTIVDAQIIKRGSRSLGYGFVAFEQESDAVKAISQFDKKELSNRTINVELAKPAPTSHNAGAGIPEQAAEAGRGRGGRGRARGRPSRGRGRGGRRPQADGEADAGVEGPTGTEEAGEGAVNGSAPRGGRGRGRGRGRGGIRPRRVGPPEGEPSKTLIFVANLPFTYKDEEVKELFTNEGYTVVSAHVVTRKYGPVAGKSKGFGFVEFASEADQEKALKAFDGKEIDGRPIQVKVAINSDRPEDSAEPTADETA